MAKINYYPVKVQKIIPFLAFALFWHFTSVAQTIKADFTADKTTGCPPSLTVKFTNTSTGSGLTYTWDFANGGGTSTEKDPTAVFVNPGLYTVRLTVTNGTTSDSKTMDIRVYNPPTADFKANLTKACSPLTTTFTDLSTKGDGTINKWDWDFRNGTKSTLQTPAAVTYTGQSKFTVYLKVTDSNGCFGQSEKTNYIDVVNKPSVSFTPSPSKSCKVPQDVNFTNTSTGSGSLSYEWNFGNGDQKYTQNPKTTYNSFGIYTVTLTVNATDYNCNATLAYPAVNISQIKASGLIKQDTTTIHSNDTICAGPLTFTNQSNGATNVYWNFGDGNYSFLTTATHSYNTAGKYTVSLIASSSGLQCADTVKWIINVEKVTADFSFSPTSGCTSPISVVFTNKSTNAKSYQWKFSDNTTKTETNPSFIYTIKPDKDPYAIHHEDSYPIILSAYGQHGCVSKSTQYFKVNLPTALYSIDKSEGCAPLTVTFTDNSLPTGNITSRKWIFGDNNETTTASSSIQHKYNSPGSYNAKLVVTDINGCKDTSYSITIKAGKKPTPNFQVTTPSTFYSDELVNIKNLSLPGGDSINYWNYSINGNSIANCWDDRNPSFKFKADTGKLSVRLLVGSNGCFEDTVFQNLITNLGPVGSFSYNLNCATPLKYSFIGIAKGATAYEWDFGDGDKDASTLTPDHTFKAAGDYQVKLITINNLHYDTATVIIYARIPNAIYTAKASTCINDAVKFNSKASHSIYSTCSDKYKWDFGDGSNLLTMNDSIDHSFSKRGEFNVTLTALYENGCTSSNTQKIRVFSPYAKIKTDTTSGCDNLKVLFTDISGTDGSSLTSWNWNFADGTPDSIFSTGGHKITKYFKLPTGLTSNKFPVVLSVKDIAGCTGTDTANIRISQPTANFYISSQSDLCVTDTAKLVRYFTDADSAIWYFGDGTIDRFGKNPVIHKYSNQGNYNIALKIYKYHCTDSVNVKGYIRVQKADAKFMVSDSILNCQGEIKFNHIGNMSPVDSGTWHFGDQGNKGAYDTVKYYNYYLPGTYKTKLRVYTSFGCADTFEREIKVFGPYADIAMNPRKACKGDTVTFMLRDTANVFKWEWNFGEGIAYKNIDTVKYVFRSVGTKPITLVAYRKDTVCFFTSKKEYTIETVTAKIGVADTSVCDGKIIQFSNLSTGQTSFNWDLGNGTTSILNEPQITYTAGVYKVKLAVKNDNNCKDTALQAMLINPIPKIRLSNDTLICKGSSLTLHASGGNAINWYPNKWLSANNVYNPVTSADSTIKYVINVSVDTTSCSAKDSVLITVQQKPAFVLIPNRDTSIFVGDDLSLNISAIEAYNYIWSPQTYLLCNADCSSAYVKPEDSITYFLTVKDIYHCFTENRKIKISVKDTCTFDVANAFTPNGDEKNRILKVEGKGIKQLVDFSIYNRWGNLVFQTNDLSKGWDGTTKGKIQPIDSYVYTITVLTYKGFTLSKKGSVLLIR